MISLKRKKMKVVKIPMPRIEPITFERISKQQLKILEKNMKEIERLLSFYPKKKKSKSKLL